MRNVRRLQIVTKVLKYGGVSIGVVVLGIVGVGYYLFSNMCVNTIVASSGSPDGRWKVVLFERNCGATTGFSSQISLIDASNELKNKSGNIYISEGRPEGYSLNWKSDNSVEITGARGKNYIKEAELNGVHFTYE